MKLTNCKSQTIEDFNSTTVGTLVQKYFQNENLFELKDYLLGCIYVCLEATRKTAPKTAINCTLLLLQLQQMTTRVIKNSNTHPKATFHSIAPEFIGDEMQFAFFPFSIEEIISYSQKGQELFAKHVLQNNDIEKSIFIDVIQYLKSIEFICTESQNTINLPRTKLSLN